ncbi:MAG: tetratricopeptide repeat protein [Candidatus Sericytochromatia bacterium]|nr:tetratricopeptide repeat protein [Candidatus Sericytochromatia bacterium]
MLIKSKDKDFHNLLGNSYADNNSFDSAIKSYLKAIVLDDKYDDAYRNIGLAYIDLGQHNKADEYFKTAYLLKYGSTYKSLSTDYLQYDFSEKSKSIVTGSHKLKHDIEQINHLLGQKLLPNYFNKVIENYKEILLEISTKSSEFLVELTENQKKLIDSSYDRNLHLQDTEFLKPSAINQNNDFSKISDLYFDNKPSFIYFDDFLSIEALEKIQSFCLNSTIWHEYKRDRGYLASYMNNGFSTPLLYQIAEEIKNKLPNIFKNYDLMNMWAFKYDSQMSGVVAHADQAMINLNFWITTDLANKDKESGGMVIYDIEAPKEWDFEKYNSDTNLIHEFLKNNNANKIIIPYKQNRVVIFNSGLFHETDKYLFKEGYENRRINITMLFGKKES